MTKHSSNSGGGMIIPNVGSAPASNNSGGGMIINDVTPLVSSPPPAQDSVFVPTDVTTVSGGPADNGTGGAVAPAEPAPVTPIVSDDGTSGSLVLGAPVASGGDTAPFSGGGSTDVVLGGSTTNNASSGGIVLNNTGAPLVSAPSASSGGGIVPTDVTTVSGVGQDNGTGGAAAPQEPIPAPVTPIVSDDGTSGSLVLGGPVAPGADVTPFTGGVVGTDTTLGGTVAPVDPAAGAPPVGGGVVVNPVDPLVSGGSSLAGASTTDSGSIILGGDTATPTVPAPDSSNGLVLNNTDPLVSGGDNSQDSGSIILPNIGSESDTRDAQLSNAIGGAAEQVEEAQEQASLVEGPISVNVDQAEASLHSLQNGAISAVATQENNLASLQNGAISATADLGVAAAGFPTRSTYAYTQAADNLKAHEQALQKPGGWGSAEMPTDPANNVLAIDTQKHTNPFDAKANDSKPKT